MYIRVCVYMNIFICDFIYDFERAQGRVAHYYFRNW